MGQQVPPRPEGSGAHEEEVPRQRGLLLRRGWPLLLAAGLLPLVPENGGEACVGGWTGAFAFAGLEKQLVVEVVQQVVVVVEMVVLRRGCCQQYDRTLGCADVLVDQFGGAFTEDLLDLRLSVGGRLSPNVVSVL